MLILPYQIIKWIFGSTENFFTTVTILTIIGLIIRRKGLRATKVDESEEFDNDYWLNDAQRKHKSRFDYLNEPVLEAAKARREQETREKREAERLEKYRKNREGKPPTYEEWKAAKLAEEHSEQPKPYHLNSAQLGTNRLDLIDNMYQQSEPSREKRAEPGKAQSTSQPEPKAGNNSGYEAVSILTPNEKANFKALKEAADKKGYYICPKVRLADLVTPHKGPEFMSRFGKIKSKHVDFTICDSNMRTIAVIELDDSSHDRPDRIERDKFVDQTLRECGYIVIHTRHITPDILDKI